MIRTATIIVFSLFVSIASYAQVKGGAEDFSKLFDLYVMGEWEDCAYKADAMTQKEKYLKSPEPWLYVSMCYLKMSAIDEFAEDYPKAKVDAFKTAAKFRKKDKDNSIFLQNQDYFDELKEIGCADAHWWFGEDNPKKAASAYKLVYNVDEEDRNLQFMTGACYAMANLLGDAKLYLNEAVPALDALYASDEYEPNKVTEPVLVDAIVLYSDFLVQKELADSAKSMVTRAIKWMPENEDLKKQLEKL